MKTARNTAPLVLFLIAVALLAANLRAPLAALGPLVGMIRADLGSSGTFMGVVAALPMLAFALFSPLAVRLSARLAPARVLSAAVAVLAGGMAVRSWGPSETLLALGTLLLAAAVAMGNVLLPALAKRNLPSRVGLVVGTLSAGMSLSLALTSAATAAVPEGFGRLWAPAVSLKRRFQTASMRGNCPPRGV